MDSNTCHRRAARRSSRAVVLLHHLVATDVFKPDEIARALVISDATLDAYLSESKAMPLERQLCLALFVIERVPRLSRLGYQLRGQLGAVMAFQDRETVTHSEPPHNRF